MAARNMQRIEINIHEKELCIKLVIYKDYNKMHIQQNIIIIIISWRYSPGWALASATICLQVSQSLALSLHSFIPIFLRSMDTSSSHLIHGLPLRLVAYSFPYSIFFGILVSCILSICPSSAKCQVGDSGLSGQSLSQSGIHYVPRLIVGFRNNYFLQGEVVSLMPNPQPGGPGYPLLSGAITFDLSSKSGPTSS